MSTPNNSSQKAYDHIFKRVGYIALLCFMVFLIWKLGNVWIERVVNTQQEQVSQTIINTINEQANQNLLLPEIVFINADTIAKRKFTESFKTEIVSVLSKKYLTNEKVNPKDVTFQPFFLFPELAESSGNYKLTKSQLEDLKNHIVFLTNQVDKAVTQTKDEINKEIDRINTWVSIWIGVLSIFGTIIPLFYNYKNNEDLKKIKEEAVEAKVSSTEALRVANNANVKATKVEKLISTLNDVSKIKDLDASFLLYNDRPLETLKRYLSEIYTNLSNCSDLSNDPIIKDVLRQLSLRIHLLSISTFIQNPRIFELLNEFALDLSDRIGQPFTVETYNEAISLLNGLNVNLEREDTLN